MAGPLKKNFFATSLTYELAADANDWTERLLEIAPNNVQVQLSTYDMVLISDGSSKQLRTHEGKYVFSVKKLRFQMELSRIRIHPLRITVSDPLKKRIWIRPKKFTINFFLLI